jgi:hypothetical protein
MKEENYKKIIEHSVEFLIPKLTPYEFVLYLLLLHDSHIKLNTSEVRMGKRTIGVRLGGSRGKSTAFAHVTELLKGLEEKGCIEIHDANRDGTLYKVFLPEMIPFVSAQLSAEKKQDDDDDYFNDPSKRVQIFERDKWLCHYCGDKVTEKNATIDHLHPQSKGGKNDRENLVACCLMCNSLKSGKTYEEAAPVLLKNIKERKQKR